MGKIFLAITSQDLAESDGKPNSLPSFLIEAWKSEKGKNPIADAKTFDLHIDGIRKWHKRFWAAALISSLIACALMVWMVLATTMSGAYPSAEMRFAFAAALAVAVATIIAKRSRYHAERVATASNSALTFLTELNTLATVLHNHVGVKLSTEKLSAISKDELKELADKVLVSKAVDVLLTQDKARNVPKEMQDSKGAIYRFKLFFDGVFKPFGLADKRYDRYFDLARKEIDLAKTSGTPIQEPT